MTSIDVQRAVLLWATGYADAFLRAHSDTTAAILAFLDDNVHLTANALAVRAGFSVRTLERRVLQATGFPVATCRTRARVRRAVELLEIGLKVDSAAEAVGWRSKKDLYHAFRTCVPFLPGDVRKMTREEVQIVVKRLSGPGYGR
jgi:transcriptional regulator GlxA family with amidase domain